MIEKAMEVAEKVPEEEEQMEEEEEDEGENTENILPSSQRIEVINNSKAKKKQVKENDGDDPLFKLEGTIVNTCPSSYKNISNFPKWTILINQGSNATALTIRATPPMN